jgi:hypothetical protein
MAFQYGVALRNNQVAQIQATIGASGTLKIFSGAEPANCAAADPTGLLATITLPAAFLTSSGGVTTIAGSWTTSASGGGAGTNAQSFRMYDGSSVCHVQGNVTTDLVLNNVNIATGQTVSVTQFSVTAGNQ